MVGRGRTRCVAVATLVCVTLAAGRFAQATLPGAPSSRVTTGYADSFTALSAQTRDFDHGPQAVFSYCARNTAVYECLSYGRDGAVRKERRKTVLHGTAFAYRRQGADTLLLTNEHVAAWPMVTDAQHVISGIPAGCKRMSESLTLVDDERDSYDRDDVALSRVLSDAELDIAILKTRASLQVMPWKIGHSAYLRERDVVEVRGFPLGAFRATNVGKVVSALNHDDYGEWDHDDFVIDALLSAGNSGSPVLALSPMTGEYELVGVFHAGYSEGSALNVVVGIDQVRDMMTTLKRTPRPPEPEAGGLGSGRGESLLASLGPDRQMFFPFGSLVAQARAIAADRLLFAVYPKEFPFASDPSFVVEDTGAEPTPEGGAAGKVWLASTHGIDEYDRNTLDAETQNGIARLLRALRADASAHARYRAARRRGFPSREAFEQISRMTKGLNRVAANRTDLIQLLADLPERFTPALVRRSTTLAEIVSWSPPPPAPSGGKGGGAAPAEPSRVVELSATSSERMRPENRPP